MKIYILFFLLLFCSCRITKIEIEADASLRYNIEREVRSNGKVKIDTISKNIHYRRYEKDSTNFDKYPPYFYNDYIPKNK